MGISVFRCRGLDSNLWWELARAVVLYSERNSSVLLGNRDCHSFQEFSVSLARYWIRAALVCGGCGFGFWDTKNHLNSLARSGLCWNNYVYVLQDGVNVYFHLMQGKLPSNKLSPLKGVTFVFYTLYWAASFYQLPRGIPGQWDWYHVEVLLVCIYLLNT